MSPVSDGFRHPHRASDEEAGAVPIEPSPRISAA